MSGSEVYKGWYRDSWGGWVFIHPANDVFPHFPYAADCPCNPLIDGTHQELVHSAFDARDLLGALQRGENIV